MTIWNNDEARAFFIDNGLPEQYNDGMTAYLRELLGKDLSLPDLLREYVTTYGTTEFTALTQPVKNYSFSTGSLDADFTFTRASAGYYYNSSGTLVSAAINTPRFDYNPSTLVIRGLLLEEASTNLTNYSEEADNVYWTKQAVTVSANATTAPDGNLTADSMTETAVTNSHGIDRNGIIASLTSGNYITASVYAKQGSGTRRLQIVFGGTAFGTAPYANFNLDTGVATLGAQATAREVTITSLPNGWYRCTFTVQADVTGTVRLFYRLANSNNASIASYAGDGSSFIYLWGMQLEELSFATSYIQTVAASASRSADSLAITGLTFSGFWNATEGTIKVVGINDGDTSGVYLTVNDTTALEQILFNRTSATNANIKFTDGGVDQFDQTLTGSGNNSTIKMCLGYKLNDSNMAVNGVLGTSDTSATIPTVTQVQFNGLNWWITNFVYYNVKLNDSQIRSLTNGV